MENSETLHEQLTAYIPKLEHSIIAYTKNPANPNAAQGIMAMLECLELLKSSERSICRGKAMSKEDAEHWAKHLINGDGTTGPHWTMEQTTTVAENMGLTWEKVSPLCWWITLNMIYSDYYSVAARYGVSSPDFYADMAKAFLFDEDGPKPKEKISAYYWGIAAQ